MLQSINVIIRKSPGHEPTVLAARAAWAMLSAGGYEVAVICLHEGGYALRKAPGYLAGLLERFAGEEGRIVTTQETLALCALSEDDLLDGVEVLDAQEIADLIAEADATTAY